MSSNVFCTRCTKIKKKQREHDSGACVLTYFCIIIRVNNRLRNRVQTGFGDDGCAASAVSFNLFEAWSRKLSPLAADGLLVIGCHGMMPYAVRQNRLPPPLSSKFAWVEHAFVGTSSISCGIVDVKLKSECWIISSVISFMRVLSRSPKADMRCVVCISICDEKWTFVSLLFLQWLRHLLFWCYCFESQRHDLSHLLSKRIQRQCIETIVLRACSNSSGLAHKQLLIYG